MNLTPNSKLGPYEILAPIGAGGMGEVYKARDTRLDRLVAIKVLGRDFSDRPDVLQRFEREARVISTLNHPNICTLHDIGSEDGSPYLVMEYLEGETLDARLARGPLQLAEACRIAVQIGEALEHAHARNIIHRDLKPANVMLTGPNASTSVKLLDFGLAKPAITPPSALISDMSSLPTVALTIEGSIVGTLQYMSPEQLEGKDTDARSDIFGFGGLIYEMVTGHKAFQGQSQAALITAIMGSDPPPVSSFQPKASAALDRLVQRCLVKNPENRWQSLRDLVSELRWIAEGLSSVSGGSLPAERSQGTRWIHSRWVHSRWIHSGWKWLAAGACAVMLGATATWFTVRIRDKPAALPVVRFEVAPPEGQALTADSLPVLSPDGTRIVFNTARDRTLVVRNLDSLEVRQIAGTEAGHLPFWSPDGRFVAFFSTGALRKVDIEGGPPVIVTSVRGAAGGSWSRDGTIVFSPTPASPLMRVDAAGGKAEPVTRLDTARGEVSHGWPSFLPDGRHFLFTAYSSQPDQGGVYVGSLDSPGVTRILPDDTNAQYADPALSSSIGLLLYTRRNVLTAQPFDLRQLRFTGEPFAVAEKISTVARPAGSAFSAGNAALAYHVSPEASRNRLAWFDRTGRLLSELGPAGDYSSPAVSPDGQSVAATLRDPTSKTRDIWVYDATRGTGTRLTFGLGDNFSPVWSPDNRYVAFLSTREGSAAVYRKLASGGSQEERIAEAPGAVALSDWTSDGRFLSLTIQAPGKLAEIWLLALAPERKLQLLLNGPFALASARISPDGKWMAYMSNESGAGGYETYVETFPPTGNKWRISAATGEYPQWRSDSRELLLIESRHYKIMSAAIGGGPGKLQASAPTVLFQGPLGDFTLASFFSVAPGAQRFLVVRADNELSTRPFTVVLNWQARLKR